MSNSVHRYFWVILLLTILLPQISAAEMSPSKVRGITASDAAEYIHFIIEANRTIYSQVIVERLGFTISLRATENWEKDKTLPLPAQFLLLSSEASAKKNSGMSYRLMSLWPVNPKNSPKDENEKHGLEKVLENPKKPYTRTVTQGGKLFFKAISPDLAVTRACVTCHNNHPKSSKKDFKLGDVMGGISIQLPIDKNFKDPKTNEYLIAAEVVSDYIHSVLESDRGIYSKYIVNRLQKQNIVFASEHWWEDNALMLPAQFLLNASDLMNNQKLKLDFKLISAWPINSFNSPANEFERRGLDHVAQKPFRPFTEIRTLGNKQYFQAIYPDFAVAPTCVSCHNNHSNSPKRDFKLNDVMGGIVLTFPLSER